MPKDLQGLISKATKAAGTAKAEGAAVAEGKFKEPAAGPDELVKKHAEEVRVKELLVERDQRVNEGMDLLLSAADSILSAKRCGRADQP
jgi:hypothetical protein